MLEYRTAARRSQREGLAVSSLTDEHTSAEPSSTASSLANPQQSRIAAVWRSSTPVSSPSVGGASRAALAQMSGQQRLAALMRAVSGENESTLADSAASMSSSRILSELELIEQDKRDVDKELQRYIGEGLMTDKDQVRELDLLRFWQVSETICLVSQLLTRSIGEEVYLSHSVQTRPRCFTCASFRCPLREMLLFKQDDYHRPTQCFVPRPYGGSSDPEILFQR
ncbi:hypothetical protein BV25DRAFT_1146107 [Artomyces pyxidatus]|uniref:Uncharacterized protein n=1 Tax=Artomyces pyxidatus TaxID=48021 RepID=A0ACB8SRS5_9AGAM|nr:hypothetical protein BV25DRAFT_1146107 [Artomyces pyxidatus]